MLSPVAPPVAKEGHHRSKPLSGATFTSGKRRLCCVVKRSGEARGVVIEPAVSGTRPDCLAAMKNPAHPKAGDSHRPLHNPLADRSKSANTTDAWRLVLKVRADRETALAPFSRALPVGIRQSPAVCGGEKPLVAKVWCPVGNIVTKPPLHHTTYLSGWFIGKPLGSLARRNGHE